jgi:DNA processing protein
MQLDASLSWLALGLTPGLASRLSARVLRQFGSPEGVSRASKRDLETCHLPSETAEAVLKRKAFPRAEKELAAVRKIDGCSLVNWTEPEYPQTLLQIYDPPVLLYVRGDQQVLNLPSLSIVRNEEADSLRDADGSEAGSRTGGARINYCQRPREGH